MNEASYAQFSRGLSYNKVLRLVTGGSLSGFAERRGLI